jgi:flagellar motor switch protein FliM
VNSESLSQDEIDLLFSGGEDSAPEPAIREAGPETQIYDFRRPARISKDRKRSLEAIYGLLAKSLEGWLTGRVRDQIELELQSVEQLTFGEFMLALPSPCSSFVVDVQGMGTSQGVIDFGQEFAYFIVDRILGGNAPLALMNRSLSPTERLIVRIVAERVAAQLCDVWRDYVRMDLAVSGFETIPEMLQVANREDPVLVANIAVTMGEIESSLLLCLPFAMLEKFFTTSTTRKVQGAQGTTEERNTERRSIEGVVRASRISVEARFPDFEVPLATLADLKPGSVLTTELSPESGLHVFVAGQKRFAGVPGRVGQNLAIRVLDPVTPEPEDIINPGRERSLQ